MTTPKPDHNGLSEDAYFLLAKSVRSGLLAADHEPEPSEPTSFMGAPDLGHGWRNAWDDTHHHADRAFGEA